MLIRVDWRIRSLSTLVGLVVPAMNFLLLVAVELVVLFRPRPPR